MAEITAEIHGGNRLFMRAKSLPGGIGAGIRAGW
jgi:hypothetical protein